MRIWWFFFKQRLLAEWCLMWHPASGVRRIRAINERDARYYQCQKCGTIYEELKHVRVT